MKAPCVPSKASGTGFTSAGTPSSANSKSASAASSPSPPLAPCSERKRNSSTIDLLRHENSAGSVAARVNDYLPAGSGGCLFRIGRQEMDKSKAKSGESGKTDGALLY